jgi:hypothetical protein
LIGQNTDWTEQRMDVNMGLRIIRWVLLILICCTALTLAAQDPASAGDGGCRQIAGQLPTPRPRSVMGLPPRPITLFGRATSNGSCPFAAATELLIARGVNSHIQSISFARAASRGSNVSLGIKLGAAGLMYVVGCSEHRSSYAANPGLHCA